jgi:uroporphyrinogen-III synthase
MSKPPAPSKKPLQGIRILVGRARHQASVLSNELRRLGAQVVEIPFIEIRKPRSFKPLDSTLKNLDRYDWLILTSVNGVEAMWDRWKKIASVPVGKRLQVAAIGPATRKAIEERGLKVDVVPKEYVAESVVRSLRAKVKGKRVLLVRAKIARDVIPRELRRAGAKVDVVEAYETVLPKLSRGQLRAMFESEAKRPQVVTFTSSSTVTNFVKLLGQPGKKCLRAMLHGTLTASIGPVTSATLRKHGLRADIAATEFTIPGLISVVVRTLTRPQIRD